MAGSSRRQPAPVKRSTKKTQAKRATTSGSKTRTQAKKSSKTQKETMKRTQKSRTTTAKTRPSVKASSKSSARSQNKRTSTKKSSSQRGQKTAKQVSWQSQTKASKRIGPRSANQRKKAVKESVASSPLDIPLLWAKNGSGDGKTRSQSRRRKRSAQNATRFQDSQRQRSRKSSYQSRPAANSKTRPSYTKRKSQKNRSALSAFFSFIFGHRVLRNCFIVFLALIAIGTLDMGLNWDRAYPGVKVGDIDVGGKTRSEISEIVASTYTNRLATNKVTIYASEDAQNKYSDELKKIESEAQAEQISAEAANANKEYWVVDMNSLIATLQCDEIADEAIQVGRSNGGLPARLLTPITGYTISPHASFSTDKFDSLTSSIDSTLGNERQDTTISIENGSCQIVDGHDGKMVDRDKLSDQINHAFFDSPDEGGSFIVNIEDAPDRISHEDAQRTSDAVNRILASGVQFSYEDKSWTDDGTEVGQWISVSMEENNGMWHLKPYMDNNKARAHILENIYGENQGMPISITYEKAQDGSIWVHTDGQTTIPFIPDTLNSLNDMLFGENGRAWDESQATEGNPVEVSIESGAVPESLSFDEAINLGVVCEVASYTTEYSTNVGTENRNSNIHLAADMLNNSIVTANGGTWSFNSITGERTEDKGFKGAGTIIDGEIDDAVGGGICQVATTIFNAVYESGLPVLERHNHTLYIASYPAGRDAAVSWPDLDLKWQNDTQSDLILRMSYTDDSVTATLYGIDPGYIVSTDVGKWEKGKEYSKKTEEDEDLPRGQSYVKTPGSDGRTISVTRTVKNVSGQVIRTDVFDSVYDPVTEVTVEGTGT